MSDNRFGTPRIGGKSQAQLWKAFWIKEGEDNIYRLFPPLGDLAETGTWAVFYRDHNGYGVPNPTDPGKPYRRPFMCPKEYKDWKTKLIKVPCVKCDQIETKKAELESLETRAREAGWPKEKLDLAAAPLKKWIRTHYVQGQWRIAVMNQIGELGVLFVPHKVKLLVEQLYKELSEGRRPINLFDVDSGCWLNFRRSGNKKNIGEVQYKVDVVRSEEVMPDGRVLYDIKSAALTEDQKEKALSILPDLRTVVRIITAEQIQRLVDSDETPESTQAILEGPLTGAEASPGFRKPVAPASHMSQPTTKFTPEQVKEAQAVTQSKSEEEEEAELLAKFRAQRAAAKSAAPAVAAAPPAPAKTVSVPTSAPAMSGEATSEADFLEFMAGHEE